MLPSRYVSTDRFDHASQGSDATTDRSRRQTAAGQAGQELPTSVTSLSINIYSWHADIFHAR